MVIFTAVSARQTQQSVVFEKLHKQQSIITAILVHSNSVFKH